jgi:hypothetical protein
MKIGGKSAQCERDPHSRCSGGGKSERKGEKNNNMTGERGKIVRGKKVRKI